MIDALATAAAALPLAPWALALAVTAVFSAYIVFGVTGFGAALIVVPILSHLMPMTVLIPLAVVLDLTASSLVGVRGRRQVAAAEILRIAPAAAIGALIGVTVLVSLPRDESMLALGAFLVAYGVWSLRAEPPATPVRVVWAPIAGVVGGTCGTLFGIGGPPYAIYLARRIFDKARLRATIGMMVFVSLVIRLGVLTGAGLLLQPGLAALLAVLLPVCLLSIWIGGRITRAISREALLRVIAALLTVSGTSLVLRALF